MQSWGQFAHLGVLARHKGQRAGDDPALSLVDLESRADRGHVNAETHPLRPRAGDELVDVEPHAGFCRQPTFGGFGVEGLEEIGSFIAVDQDFLVQRLTFGSEESNVGSQQHLIRRALGTGCGATIEQRDEVCVVQPAEIEASVEDAIDEVGKVRCRFESCWLHMQSIRALGDEARQRNLPSLQVGEVTDGTFRMLWHSGSQIPVNSLRRNAGAFCSRQVLRLHRVPVLRPSQTMRGEPLVDADGGAGHPGWHACRPRHGR
ncbi:MAG: hypothetical protein AW12_02129 [Candidatus Accumulibacter sp. BA-94]|nr:MAG: hypothetical protein AW12_02129 [Candidatus Accumulibacter sp. BA-94]